VLKFHKKIGGGEAKSVGSYEKIDTNSLILKGKAEQARLYG